MINIGRTKGNELEEIEHAKTELLKQAKIQPEEYFHRKKFELPIKLNGTMFQQKCGKRSYEMGK